MSVTEIDLMMQVLPIRDAHGEGAVAKVDHKASNCLKESIDFMIGLSRRHVDSKHMSSSAPVSS